MPVPDKINKKEAELMQNFARRAGYGIAPDMRYHLVRPEPEGHIVLFPEGHAEFYVPSAEFTSVSVALRLGAMIAQMDKRVDVAEQATLEKPLITMMRCRQQKNVRCTPTSPGGSIRLQIRPA
jgi:hypothetical protein